MSNLRRGTKALAVFCAGLALVTSGCGDALVCQTEVLVAISEPSGVVSTDVSADLDGVQTDVHVQTTLARGVELTLTVIAGDGQESFAFATTDSQGNAVFEDVTVPAGGADLRVRGDAGECGFDEDVRSVQVTAGADCELEFATAPLENDFYAPLDVFNASTDSSATTPGHQGDVIVRAPAGQEVTLFLSGAGQVETAIGSGTTDVTGEVRLAVTLPDGQDNLRAECTAAGNGSSQGSGLTSVFVDTAAPTCVFTSPVVGTTITPSLDTDLDLSNGIQVSMTVQSAGGDVSGEPAMLVVTAPGGGSSTTSGTVGTNGELVADVTFDPATPPADFVVTFSTNDHAGNVCEQAPTFRVVYDGCPIVVTAPITTMTTDADGNPANGAQIDIVLDVDEACLGRSVTSDCGSNDVGGTVGSGGALTLRADLCDGVPCEASELCTVRVTSTDGIETTAGVNLAFDNQPPNVSVQVARPAGVTCGGTVTPGQDVAPATQGTQIAMRVVSPSAADRQLRMINSAGTTTVPANGAGGEVEVTIENGSNDFVGIATDAVGNVGTTASCIVTLADIAVSFTGSPADGSVGSGDGTEAAGELTFLLTGTVSTTGATVTVTVDGGAPQTAVVTGTSWSLPLTLPGRATPYAIVATATAAPQVGTATLSLLVDLSAPGDITGLTAIADTRQSVRLSFTAPSDGGGPVAGYRIRYSTTVLTDANFDTSGSAVNAPTPGAPGSPQTVSVRPLRTGTAYWVGIAALDGSGNRSTAQIVGPLTPRFDQSAVIAAPNAVGDAAFGLAMTRGRFNDDAFDDVAVSAPFVTSNGLAAAGEVYVYFGSATGLAATPGVTIRGETADANFGASLARVRWSGSSHDDLAIGEPFGDGFNGVVYVFDGGAAFPAGTVAASTAQRRIAVATTVNWFSGSALGWQLQTADHDGDGIDDLVTSAIFGDSGAGGAALVFYGGTVPTGLVRISDTSAAGSGTAVIRMYEQPGSNLFGYYVHAVGPTQGPSDAGEDLAVAFVEDSVAGAELLVLRASGGRPASPGVTRESFTIGRDVRIRYDVIDAILEWGSSVGSIADQNGDGAREIVIGDFRSGSDAGIVFVVDGATVGVDGIATVPGPAAYATIQANVSGSHLGMAVVNNAMSSDPDVDGDGSEDLVVAGRTPGTTQAEFKVWFGPLAPGLEIPAMPDHVITGPASFQGVRPNIGTSPITAIWAGDVNADGLDDVCWADWTSAGRDGGLQVLWDDGN